MVKLLCSTSVLDEINRRIVAAFPECKNVYIDLAPQEFLRPAFLIELIKTDCKDVNLNTVKHTDYFLITAFDIVDERYETQTLRLMGTQQRLIGIFADGFLRLEGRAPKVQATSGGRDFDRTYVDVQISYSEQRTADKKPLPIMENLKTKIREE
ncbi:MAG: hypothetical protein RR639_04315 [Hydrogenoanaerobacterium sp.]